MNRRKSIVKIAASTLIGIGLLACLDWFVGSPAVALFPSRQAEPASPVGTTEVRIGSFAFTPGNLTIQAGTTVRWENFDPVSHTVTSVEPAGIFNSDPLGTGASFQYLFASPGIYTYHCNIHHFMTGTVTVLGRVFLPIIAH